VCSAVAQRAPDCPPHLSAGPISKSFAKVTDSTNIGLPSNGVFPGSSVERVQVDNSNLHIEIPLYSVQEAVWIRRFSVSHCAKTTLASPCRVGLPKPLRAVLARLALLLPFGIPRAETARN